MARMCQCVPLWGLSMTIAFTPDQQVNVFTPGNQVEPRITVLADGGYVVVWLSEDQNGSGQGVVAQRYDAQGQRIGLEVFVESDTVGAQTQVDVAAVGSGFVVTWRNVAADEIRARLFDAAAAPAGDEFVVNTNSWSSMLNPAATALPGGGFVIAWTSYNDTTFTYDIRAQRYTAAGAPDGGEFTVNTTTANFQDNPALATLPGGFVAVWYDPGSTDIIGQRFDASGVAQGGEFTVNNVAGGTQNFPQVAALTGGGFVVVWESSGGDSNGSGVRARLFSDSGVPLGDEFLVNETETGSQRLPVVTATADGGFFIAWQSDYTGGAFTRSVFGRQYAADGTPDPVGEVKLNDRDASESYNPAVAALPNGLIAAVWDTGAVDGDGDGRAVMQRLFGAATLTVDLPTPPSIEALSPARTFTEAALNAGPLLIDAEGAVAVSAEASLDGGRLLVQRITEQGDAALFTRREADRDIIGVADAGGITVSGTTVSFEGAVFATILQDGADGLPLEIGFGAAATRESVEALLEALTYRNLSNDPAAEVRLAVALEDGQGGAAVPQVVTITIVPEADAPVPVGEAESQVNSFTAGNQDEPDVAALSDGGWVTVWRSDNQDGSGAGVFGQRFDATGAPVGGEFRVNAVTQGGQHQPAVAGLAGGPLAGGFVAVWYDAGASAGGYVRARLYGADGTPTSDEIRVATTVLSTNQQPDVASFADGGFVAVWSGWASGGYDIRAQRFDPSGAQVGGEIVVNTTAAGSQTEPQVVVTADGGFAVVWTDQNPSDGSGYGIYTQRFAANGAAVGGEVLVNTVTASNQWEPSIGALTDGGTVIAWRSDSGLDGSAAGVFAQRFAADGTPVGGQFLVNETTTNNQYEPAVLGLAGGGFAIAWRGQGGPGGSGEDIQIQYYDANGFRLDGETRVNTQILSTQYQPTLAQLANGDVVVAWTDNSGFDGSGTGVFQRVVGNPANYPAVGQGPQVAGFAPVRTLTETEANAGPQLLSADGAVHVAVPAGSLDGGVLGLYRVDRSAPVFPFAAPDGTEQDVLGVRDEGSGAGQIGVSGSTVSYGGTPIGTIVADGQDGRDLIISLNGAATAEAVTALMTNLTYANPSDAPAPLREYRLTLSDGQGGVSTPALLTIAVTPDTDGVSALTGEVRANTYIPSTQDAARVAALDDGGYVAVWRSSAQDGNSFGIFGQRFDAAGRHVGAEFQVNIDAIGSEEQPDVVGLAGGGFAVVWYDSNDSANGYVKARVFDAMATATTGDIAVTTTRLFINFQPAVTAHPTDGFVVAWAGWASGGYDIRTQRFDGAGAPIGSEQTINTTTAGSQVEPAIVALAGGGFAVAWTDQGGGDGSGFGIYARRLDATGAPTGAEIAVNSFTAGTQQEPTIAALTDGGFVVAWRDDNGLDSSGQGVFAQRFDATGAAVGAQFRVNEATASTQSQPMAVGLPDGGFAIAYSDSSGTDGSGWGVFLQQYNADGSRRDGPVLINEQVESTQSQAALAVLDSGALAAIWTSSTSGPAGDGSGDGVFTRLFGDDPALLPASNAQPVIGDLSGAAPFTFVEAAAGVLVDPGVSLTDTDSANFAGGTLDAAWISGTSTNDQLSVRAGGRVTVVGSAVSVDGTQVAAVDAVLNGANGATLRLALTAAATPDTVRAVIEALQYGTAVQEAASRDRTLAITLTESDGTRSTPASVEIELRSSVSRSPLVLGDVARSVVFGPDVATTPQVIDAAVDFRVNGAASFANGFVLVSYPTTAINRDGARFETLSVLDAGGITVTGSAVSFDGTQIGTIDAVENGASGTNLRITLLAAADQRSVDALLEALAYENTVPGAAATRDIRVRVTDSLARTTGDQTVTLVTEPGAQTGPQPLGPDRLTNAYLTNNQDNPAVAGLSDGGYVVVWTSVGQDGSNSGIYAQRYDAAGAPTGAEVRVNDATAFSQSDAAVTALPGGGFFVVWTDDSGLDGSSNGVFGKVYDGAGQGGPQFLVNEFTSSTQYQPAVATLSDGRVVVTWSAFTSAGSGDGSDYGVAVRLFSATGTALTGDVIANTFTTSTQDQPSVAALGTGFVVVWASANQDGNSDGIYGQRFNAAGAPVGGEFLVNQTTTGAQDTPQVTALSGGGFVVVWEGPDGSSDGIWQRHYDATGTPLGGEELVNTLVSGGQNNARVVALDGGGWIVAWDGTDTNSSGVQAQAFDATGARLGTPFIVNERQTSIQDQLALGRLSNGDVIAAWRSVNPVSLAEYDVYHRRLGTAEPSADPVIDGLPTRVEIAEADARAGLVPFAGAVALSDLDSATLDGGRLTVGRVESFRTPDAQFAPPDNAEQDSVGLASVRVNITGATVRVDGIAVGTLVSDGQAGAPLEVEFTAAATPARVALLLEALAYSNASVAPFAERTYRVTVSDGQGGVSVGGLVQIAVTPQTDGSVPVTGEIAVNTWTPLAQSQSAAAALEGGGHVVVWQSTGQDDLAVTNSTGIFGQRFDGNGTPIGPEFQVNTTFSGSQGAPSVVAVPGGGFIVAWDGNGPGDSGGVFAQTFGADGAPVGGEVLLNTFTSSTQDQVALAADGTGPVLAVWRSSGGDGNGWGVQGRLLDPATGQPTGAEFTVNTFTSSTQQEPAAAALAGGGFVAVWSSLAQIGSRYSIIAQRLSDTGARIGGEIVVNTFTDGDQTNPVVAGLADGSFVVAWVDVNGLDGSGSGIYARRFAADGAALGEQFLVNSNTSSTQDSPAIVALAGGGFVIGWRDASNAIDGSGSAVLAQQYGASGERIDDPIVLNVEGSGAQDEPTLAALAAGGFVAAWTSDTSGSAGDGSGDGVFQRVFGDPADFTLADRPVLDGIAPVSQFFQRLCNPGPQLIVTNNAAAVSDPDSANFAGGTLRVDVINPSRAFDDQINAPDGIEQDMLGLREAQGITIDGTTVRVDGVAVAVISGDGQQGAPFVLDLNASATVAAVERLVENLTYENVSLGAQPTRLLRLQLTDGDGNASEPVVVEMQVVDRADGATPLGPEAQANTFGAGSQTIPHVVQTADGFVMVWRSDGQDGASGGIYGQRFDVDGTPVGAEFRVNTTTAGDQGEPRVTATTDGGFAVAWTSADVSSTGVYLQRYAANGSTAGGETLVNTFTNSQQYQPDVTVLPNGDLLAVWTSIGTAAPGGSGYDIVGQVLDPAGTPKGAEFRVNVETASTQSQPAVTQVADGGFVVSWTSASSGTAGDGSSNGVFARRYSYDSDADAYAPATGETQINVFTDGNQDDSHVTGLSGGGYVVVWTSASQDGSGEGIFARQFDANDQPVGDEFRVNDNRTSSQYQPQVAALSTGGYAVVWTDFNNPQASSYDIFVQQYAASGARVDGQILVNTNISSNQWEPTITALPDGGFVVGWSSFNTAQGGDGSGYGVFYRVFGNTAPVATDDTASTDQNTPVEIDLIANDTDADGDEIIIDAVQTAGLRGVVDILDCDIVQYTPGPELRVLALNETTDEVFTYTVTDGRGGVDTGTVTVTVVGLNDDPTLGAGVLAATEDGPVVTLDLSALGDDIDSDDDGTTLTYTVQSGPAEGTASITAFTLSFDVGADFQELALGETLEVVLGLRATDRHDAFAEADVTVTVTGVNDDPTLAAGVLAAVEDGSAVSLDLSALGNDIDSDDDGASLIYSIVGAPAEGTASVTGTSLGFAPGAAFQDLAEGETRDVTVRVRATDRHDAFAEADVTVTVTGVNDDPAFVGLPANFTVLENTATVGTVAGSDADAGTTLAFSIEGGADAALFSIDATTGALAFLAAPDFEAPGDAGGNNIYDLILGVSDGGVPTTRAVTVTVANVDEGAAATVAITASANAPEGDSGTRDVTFTLIRTGATTNAVTVSLAAFGTAVAASDFVGTIPASVVIGAGETEASFTVAVTGDIDPEANETIGVEITGLDQADHAVTTLSATHTILNDDADPVAGADSGVGFVTDEDTAFTTANVLANDSDPDGDLPLSVLSFDTTGLLGTLTDNGDGTFGYDPAGAFEALNAGGFALDTFSYVLTDAAGATDTATVTIRVNGVNDAPTGGNAAFTTDEDTDLSGDLLAASGAADVDAGDALRLTAINGEALTAGQVSRTFGSGAVLVANEDGTFTVTTAGAYDDLAEGTSTTESFSFTIADQAGGNFTATATFTVTGVNDAPVANDDVATTDEDTTVVVSLLGNDTDPDIGDTVTLVAADATGSAGGLLVIGTETVFDPNGEFDDLAAGDTRDTTFGYTIRDEAGVEASATLTVTVSGRNDAPTGGNAAFTTDEDTDLSGDLLAASGAADVDAGDALRLTAINGEALTAGQVSRTFGSGAVLVANEDGTFTVTTAGAYDDLAEGTSTTESFSFTIADQAGGNFTATATFTVTGVNDAPAFVGLPANFNVAENTMAVGTVAGIDADVGTVLAFSIAGGDDAGLFTIDPATGALAFLAAPDFELPGDTGGNNVYDLILGVSDGLVTTTGAVTVTVTDVNEGGGNQAPVAVDDTFATNEDAGVVGNLLAANPDVADSDADGDPLTVVSVTSSSGVLRAVDATTGSGLFILASGAHLRVSADGSFTYDPFGFGFSGASSLTDFDRLDDGEFGVETFTYVVTDGNGSFDEASVTITVAGVNDAPIAVIDSISLSEDDAQGSVNLLNGAIAPDVDPEGGPLTITQFSGDGQTVAVDPLLGGTLTLASGAAITVLADGTATFFTNAAFEDLGDLPGQLSQRNVNFTYTVADQDGLTDTALLQVFVTGVNDAPAPVDDSFATDEDTAIGAGLNLFADNGAGPDSDPEGDTLTVTAVNGVEASVGAQIALASGALLTVNADGTFGYDPNGAFEALNAGESATDSFVYTVSDGVEEATATVIFTIDGVDDVIGPNTIDMAPLQSRVDGTDGRDVILIDTARSAQLLGGDDADLFVFGLTAGDGFRDVAFIRDFEKGADLIDLSGVGYGLRVLGGNSIITLDTPDRDTLYVTGVTVDAFDFTDNWTNGGIL